MEYTTVFETTGVHFQIWPIFLFLIVWIGGLLLFLYLRYNEFNSTKKQLAIILAILMVRFAFFITILIVSITLSDQNAFNRTIKNKEYKIVEGIVENFKPMPSKPYHRVESFMVNGVSFENSEYDSGFGFNETPTFRGLNNYVGQQVRLTYIDYKRKNVIIKVELIK